MTNARKTSAYVDYQQRASEFAVGDLVYPFASGNPALNGRVMAVYPAIGMIDVEWPHGSERVPVEDVQQYFNQAGDYNPPSVGHDNIPGGAKKVSVPGGPVPPIDQKPPTKRANLVERVAKAYVKRALYWAAADRKYRASQEELDTGNFRCRMCKDVFMRPASYKRESGQSVKLLACPQCLFLLKPCDIENHPDNLNLVEG
jgi:hypothetical protein